MIKKYEYDVALSFADEDREYVEAVATTLKNSSIEVFFSQLPNDKPVVYKILTEGEKNNYTGVAKRGKVYVTLQQHLQGGKNYVPGSKVRIERIDSIQQAQQKADRIITTSKPKYNKPAK
ncbi:hypothetical protein [Scytonema sp. PCC 10023]|uniref:hypothetical protein n=1 Tax=Scytonema sp. PCC 10023 TaxID=1680591 RepID=UPI0039C65CE4